MSGSRVSSRSRCPLAPLATCLLAVVLVACRPAAPPAGSPVLVVGELGTRPGCFRQPRAIAIDRTDGSFFVIDRSGRIQKFSRAGAVQRVWRLPASERGQPVGVVVDRTGTTPSVLVNDSHYQRVRRYTLDGERLVASWGSEGTGPGQFTYGRDVAVDSAGNVYAGDYGGLNDRIEKFSPGGEFLLEWGRQGEGPGEFNRPQGMCIERRGNAENLLVADCSNHRIQRFRLDGGFISAWGELGTEPGQLRYPSSVAVGPDGTIFVSEWGNNRVQRFARDGKSLGVWGAPGRAPGRLATPWDVDVDAEGLIHVVDYGNHRVQVFRWPERLPEAAVSRGDGAPSTAREGV